MIEEGRRWEVEAEKVLPHFFPAPTHPHPEERRRKEKSREEKREPFSVSHRQAPSLPSPSPPNILPSPTHPSPVPPVHEIDIADFGRGGEGKRGVSG